MGKLDLDASVQRYAPTFPKKRYPITPRLLAGHLSGLPHYNEDDFVNTVHYESVTDALRKFRDRSLLFEPGAQFSYSSFGWNLLSVVVEEAAGEDFLTYMQARVFQPLEMTDTVADRYAQIIEHRTDFYNVTEDGDSFNAVAIDNSDVWAGGGYLSTSEDLVRFADGVLHGGLLEPQTVELLLSPMKTSAGKTTDYGLGWRVWDVEGHRAVGHGGGHIGATAILMALPESGLSVAILTNTGRLELKPLAELILRYYLER
jgi:CubicO group peptidase (beta-lactamase class C family)